MPRRAHSARKLLARSALIPHARQPLPFRKLQSLAHDNTGEKSNESFVNYRDKKRLYKKIIHNKEVHIYWNGTKRVRLLRRLLLKGKTLLSRQRQRRKHTERRAARFTRQVDSFLVNISYRSYLTLAYTIGAIRVWTSATLTSVAPTPSLRKTMAHRKASKNVTSRYSNVFAFTTISLR